MRVPVRKQRELSGFTLVEMAIVLVIIGIILAGVMKGRDIVRSAQMKEFAQSFGNKWVTMTQTYYDKVGQHLTDGTDNGGASAINSGRANGLMDGVGAYYGTTGDNRDELLTLLQAAGVDPCNNVKTQVTGWTPTSGQQCDQTKDPFQYVAESEYLGRVNISVAWGSFKDAASTPQRQRNYVSFINCPIEFAKAMDTLIDGEANGAGGFAVYLGNSGVQDALTPQNIGVEQTAQTPTAYPIYKAGTLDVIELCVVLDY